MFTTGDTAQGCGAVRTILDGIRTTSYDYIGGDQSFPNVEIVTRRYVDKILLEERGSELVATGVEVGEANRQRSRLEAQKVVMLASGAYGSPAVLLRSGIGPKSELQGLGLPVTVDLPGVGKNLMDHLVVLNFYEVSSPGLTNDHLIWHPGAKEKTAEEYKVSRTGFLSQFPFGVFAFARLDERLKDDPVWQDARQSADRDAMGTLPSQPHVEF
ncbi:Nn.00g074360.m01.CDS01 [Neocucurbitaria sp. VM-36]